MLKLTNNIVYHSNIIETLPYLYHEIKNKSIRENGEGYLRVSMKFITILNLWELLLLLLCPFEKAMFLLAFR